MYTIVYYGKLHYYRWKQNSNFKELKHEAYCDFNITILKNWYWYYAFIRSAWERVPREFGDMLFQVNMLTYTKINPNVCTCHALPNSLFLFEVNFAFWNPFSIVVSTHGNKIKRNKTWPTMTLTKVRWEFIFAGNLKSA